MSRQTPEYTTWCSIKQRCNNTANKSYKDYGGRGIKVCARWEVSFAAFLEDMGKRPSANYSIDRIDNDKGYTPGNCRWATVAMQSANQRPTKALQARNTSGYNGVRFDEDRGYWRAYGILNGKKVYLYRGSDKAAAITARLKFETEAKNIF